MKLGKRILVIALATIIFSIGISILDYTPAFMRDANTYYFGFFETFIFVLFFSAPVFFLVGIPISFLIDKLIEKYSGGKKRRRYFISLGLYSLAGIVIGLLLSRPENFFGAINLSILGFLASNLYFHLSLFLMSKNSSSNTQSTES